MTNAGVWWVVGLTLLMLLGMTLVALSPGPTAQVVVMPTAEPFASWEAWR